MRRVPFIPQMESAECGAAALAMIMAWHRHHVPLAEVREACDVSRDGASAAAVIEAATRYGFEAEGVGVDAEDLGELPLPAILHWEFNHFVILESIGRRGAIVVDPAKGRLRISPAALGKKFTGVALLFAPGDDLIRRSKVRTAGFYAELARQHRGAFAQIIGASLILQFVGLALPIATQLTVDRVLIPHRDAWLPGIALGLGCLIATKAVLQHLRAWTVQGLQARLDFILMRRFVIHLMHLPLQFFLQRKPGDLLDRIQSNAAVRGVFSSASAGALLDVFLVVAYGALMLAYEPKLAAWVIAIALARVAVVVIYSDRIQLATSAELAARGKESNALVETLFNQEMVRAVAAHERVMSRWMKAMVERIGAGIERAQADIVSRQLMFLFSGLTASVVFLAGGREVIHQQMTIGVFVAFVIIQNLFAVPLESLLIAVGQFRSIFTHMARLDDVMQSAPEPEGVLAPRLTGKIELEGVSFRYARNAQPVVDSVSLMIEPGEKIAIVGAVGTGKSTLARLILGLHVPDEGTIRFDGTDVRDLSHEAMRAQLGVVMQEAFLFNDTLRANLLLGDTTIDDDRLRRAVQIACIDDLIESLPSGFDTLAGENGSRFSGGERQRLCIARAIARDAMILLLDEATSALDLETERRVHTNLAALGCTRVVIAHRVATVLDADRILVVQNGRIVQQGPPSELTTIDGPFRELFGDARA